MAPTKMVIPPEAFLVNHLFEDASFFLKEAQNTEGKDPKKARTYVRASVITSFAALEALVNTLLVAVDAIEDLELPERAFAQEKRVELADDGYFEIKGQQLRSLEQKVRFLNWRTNGTRISRRDTVWASFLSATRFRNGLVHPKPGQTSYSGLTAHAAESCLIAVQKVAQILGWRSSDL